MREQLANAISLIQGVLKNSVSVRSLKKEAVIRSLLLMICTFTVVNTAAASLQISDFFSDFTSSEVAINASEYHEGNAVFELVHEGKVVESQTVPFKVNAGEQVSKVILWQKKPQYDYYTARVSLFNGTRLHDTKSYGVSFDNYFYAQFLCSGFHTFK